jgi:hypothetical protein
MSISLLRSYRSSSELGLRQNGVARARCRRVLPLEAKRRRFLKGKYERPLTKAPKTRTFNNVVKFKNPYYSFRHLFLESEF